MAKPYVERDPEILRAKLAEAHDALRKVIVACGGIAEPGVSHGFLLHAPGEVEGKLAELKVKVARAQEELDAAEAALAAEAAKVAKMRAALRMALSRVEIYKPLEGGEWQCEHCDAMGLDFHEVVHVDCIVSMLTAALSLPISEAERKAKKGETNGSN